MGRVVALDRRLRRDRLPLASPAEHHLEGDDEEEEAAGDAEGGKRDAEEADERLADEGEANEDRARDDGGAERDGVPLGARPPGRQHDENRREPRRVDGHEQRDDGAEQIVAHGRPPENESHGGSGGRHWLGVRRE